MCPVVFSPYPRTTSFILSKAGFIASSTEQLMTKSITRIKIQRRYWYENWKIYLSGSLSLVLEVLPAALRWKGSRWTCYARPCQGRPPEGYRVGRCAFYWDWEQVLMRVRCSRGGCWGIKLVESICPVCHDRRGEMELPLKTHARLKWAVFSDICSAVNRTSVRFVNTSYMTQIQAHPGAIK